MVQVPRPLLGPMVAICMVLMQIAEGKSAQTYKCLQHDRVHAAMEASSPARQASWCRPEIRQDLQQSSWQERHQSPAG